MSVHEDLAVQYHQQDTNYYCGAACAQMVLQSVGAGLLDQDDLYADNHAHSTIEAGWYTAPDGLRWTLNNRQSAKYFVLDALATEDAISRMIVWTIHHYRVAPVAMVWGSAHWLVVRGCTTSAVPTSSGDTGYTISGLDLNNPWPPTPAPGPPPPHAAGDACGSGGARGVADEHVSYATWQSDYMTGCDFGYWLGKYVAVCDPDPPPAGAPREGAPRERRGDGARLLEPESAAARASGALRDAGLLERKDWSKALRGAAAGRPALVQRLDRLDSFFWIVPMVRGKGRVSAAVSIDGRFGDYRQAIAVPAGRQGAFEVLDREAVIERVVDRRFELPERLGRLLARREALCLHPTLVWRPCLESLSPFYPFHMLTIGDHRLFVRVDGEVFTRLTVGLHGI